MNYAEIKYNDIANGQGVRTSLFVSGCRHHCPGCFNACTWDFEYGKTFDTSVEDEIITSLGPSYIQGLTILGGEPFEPENIERLFPFIKRVKEALPNKDIWMFSGFTLEQLILRENALEALRLIDVLVDGPFVEKEKDISLRFRGSRNQRLIRVPESLRAGEVVYWE